MFAAFDKTVGETIPNELCIKFWNFSGNHTEDLDIIYNTIEQNRGTTVLLQGYDANPAYINLIASCIADLYDIKIAWFSDSTKIDSRIQKQVFRYIKIGPYNKTRGDLKYRTTNQRLFKIKDNIIKDITYKCYEY